jgi:hypothetical protein
LSNRRGQFFALGREDKDRNLHQVGVNMQRRCRARLRGRILRGELCAGQTRGHGQPTQT